MEILNVIDPVQFRTYMLVLIRVSVFLFLLPVFSSNVFPVFLKACFSMVISLLIYTVVPVDLSRFPETAAATGLLIGTEVMIGMILGLCVRLFLGAVQLAGQVIGVQMGFSMINVMDPQTGSNVSVMDQFGYWVCLLIFLLLNGHHVMILALMDSFDLVPIGVFFLPKVILAKVFAGTANLFLMSVKIGAPVITSLLFVSVGFGLVAKFSPQMNVMIVAFPLKIVGGLLMFGFTLEILVMVTRVYVGGLKKLFMYLLFFMGGG